MNTKFLTALGLLLAGVSQAASVSILYFNDAHEIAPVDNGARGGAARLATIVSGSERSNRTPWWSLAVTWRAAPLRRVQGRAYD